MENIENLIIEHLRIIRSDVASVKSDVNEIKSRITSVEHGIATIRHESASQYGDIVDIHSRYDKLTERLTRIEKRLDIAE